MAVRKRVIDARDIASEVQEAASRLQGAKDDLVELLGRIGVNHPSLDGLNAALVSVQIAAGRVSNLATMLGHAEKSRRSR